MMMSVNTMTKVMYEYVGTTGGRLRDNTGQAGNQYTIIPHTVTKITGEKQINFHLNALRYRLRKQTE